MGRLGKPRGAPYGVGLMAGLLFIASNRIGDAVLSTGALRYASELAPSGPVTIACGPLPAQLFRACPRVAAVHIIQKQRGKGHWFELWRTLRGQRFDLAVDLRGTLLTFGVSAKRRIIHRKSHLIRHKIEELTQLLDAPHALTPHIPLDERALADAERIAPGPAPILALGPGANFIGKRWMPERFAAVARRLAGAMGPLGEARVVLLGAPEDHGYAEEIVRSLDADDIAAIDATGKIDLLAAAALLSRSTLFIGNDSGLMHVSAAMGAPTLGLFGPSDERVYGPYGARTKALRGRDYASVMSEGYMPHIRRSLMGEITVDAVEAAALSLLHAGGAA